MERRATVALAAALLLAVSAAPAPATRQPYVPDVTETREKQWRTLTSQAQKDYAAGQMAEGAAHAREALAVAEEIFDEDDPRTLISVNDLALNLDALHQDGEAEALLRRAFDAYLRTRGEADQNTQLAAENLIDFYASRQRYAAAQELAGWALDSRRRTMGASSTPSQMMEQRLQQLAAAATPAAPPAPPPDVASPTPAPPPQPSATPATGAEIQALPAGAMPLPPPTDGEAPVQPTTPAPMPTPLEREPILP
ncbi:tetratricopeptide repeat protein [Sphingobium aquiterrae]|uniref:tetratricopeptide repeat protein n=1 Tax=Sphingobium aquiterrae TaxID=2038656 RepID=UPI0030160FD9